MPRPQALNGGKKHIIPVRLSDREVAILDAVRGPLNRSEWVRWQIAKAKKEAGQ